MGAEEESLLQLLTESRALLDGHFVLSSGRHSGRYVQCARLLEQPERARFTGQALAARLRRWAPASILSPALGGLIIGHETAAALGVPFRFCERKDGAMKLRRGFELGEGEAVAVVEDVITTGGSAREAATVAHAAGARIVAIGAIIDRVVERQGFEAPFEALVEVDFETWDPEDCTLCAAGSEAQRPGSRQ